MKQLRQLMILTVLLFSAFLISGCFPSTVSVAPDGTIAIARGEGIFLIDLKEGNAKQIYESENGKPPSWVQWSQKGKNLLYIVGNNIYVTSPDGVSKTNNIYQASNNMGYCQWSPDEKWISISELEHSVFEESKEEDKGNNKSKEETGLEKESLPKLIIIDSSNGKIKNELKNISFIHKWVQDSKSVIAFHITKKDKETGSFSGEISQFKIDDGSITPLVYVKSVEPWLDASLSGNNIFFTAQVAEVNKAKRDEEKTTKETTHKLYRFTLNKKDSLKLITSPASLVFVSPNSKNIMISRQAQDGAELVLMDQDGNGERMLTQEIATASTEMGGGKILPVWLNDQEIMYWRYFTILSPDGKALTTCTIKLDGLNTLKSQRVQNLIEKYISEAKKIKK